MKVSQTQADLQTVDSIMSEQVFNPPKVLATSSMQSNTTKSTSAFIDYNNWTGNKNKSSKVKLLTKGGRYISKIA